jgi:amino acid transporter
MSDAIYPVLFLDYVFQLWTSASDDGVNPFVRFIILSSTSILLGYLNWLGLHIVGNMAVVIGLISMSPFLIMVLIGSFKVDTSRWLEIPSSNDGGGEPAQGLWPALLSGAILWRPLLNNLFWNLNSFDAAASYSAEVRDPGYTLPRSLAWGVVFMMSGYLLPMLVAIGATDSQPEDWVDGYLTTAAEEIGGEWLGAWVVFAAGVSNIALFQAELSADAFQLMGMAERGFVPKLFASRSRHGTPTYGIILGVSVIIAMGSFNLEELIEMLNFNYSISLILEYAAFMKLRISKPDGTWDEYLGGRACLQMQIDFVFLTHWLSNLGPSTLYFTVPRPFRIPLGTVGCFIFLLPPVLAIGVIMVVASPTTLLFSVGINISGMAIYYFYRGSPCSSTCCKYSKVPVENSTTVAVTETEAEFT